MRGLRERLKKWIKERIQHLMNFLHLTNKPNSKSNLDHTSN